jgi:hypothetical protein
MCVESSSHPARLIRWRKPCERLITNYRYVKEPGNSPLIVWPKCAALLHGTCEIVLILTSHLPHAGALTRNNPQSMDPRPPSGRKRQPDTDREITATFDREGGATLGSGADSKNEASTLILLGTRRKARSEPGHILWRDEHGADGPARRSSSVSRGVLDRATANSLATDRPGPPQDDQAAKTKLFTTSRSRILDQGLRPT